MFHVGHLRLLKGAHQFGNVYVRIGDDESVRQKKGDNRPICASDERLQILRACRYVFNAEVFSFADDPSEAHKLLIEEVKPNAYAEGPDHNNNAIYPLLEDLGIPRIIVPTKIQGTTAIEKRVKTNQSPEAQPPTT